MVLPLVWGAFANLSLGFTITPTLIVWGWVHAGLVGGIFNNGGVWETWSGSVQGPEGGALRLSMEGRLLHLFATC